MNVRVYSIFHQRAHDSKSDSTYLSVCLQIPRVWMCWGRDPEGRHRKPQSAAKRQRKTEAMTYFNGWLMLYLWAGVCNILLTNANTKKEDIQHHRGGRESQQSPSSLFLLSDSFCICFVVDKDSEITLELLKSDKCNLQFLKMSR